jgi:hypothetical protein
MRRTAPVSLILLRLVLMLVGLPLAGSAFAQDDSQLARTFPGHGLVLTLALDQSSAEKACPAQTPPAACTALVITLKNNGKQYMLTEFSTCGWMPYWVEYKKPTGGWAPFPLVQGKKESECSKNWAGYKAVLPGTSDVMHVRLLDMSVDAAPSAASDSPDGDAKGYTLLTGPDPLTIRVRRTFTGCITQGPLGEDTVFQDSAASQQCVGSAFPEKPLAILQSNELQLATTAVQP